MKPNLPESSAPQNSPNNGLRTRLLTHAMAAAALAGFSSDLKAQDGQQEAPVRHALAVENGQVIPNAQPVGMYVTEAEIAAQGTQAKYQRFQNGLNAPVPENIGEVSQQPKEITDCVNRLVAAYSARVTLSKKGLSDAVNEYNKVNNFASKSGTGENPLNAQGKEIDWRAIGAWLGIENNSFYKKNPNPIEVFHRITSTSKPEEHEAHGMVLDFLHGKGTYVVQPGDTASKIAREHKLWHDENVAKKDNDRLSLQALQRANPGVNLNLIRPGQVLNTPPRVSKQ